MCEKLQYFKEQGEDEEERILAGLKLSPEDQIGCLLAVIREEDGDSDFAQSLEAIFQSIGVI
ncbi:hypothetical protein ISS85_01670 [Candidatus Microgenomates bacterium]|nr:hypothetical protein [Candidatus Microgenomates bacterium]